MQSLSRPWVPLLVAATLVASGCSAPDRGTGSEQAVSDQSPTEPRVPAETVDAAEGTGPLTVEDFALRTSHAIRDAGPVRVRNTVDGTNGRYVADFRSTPVSRSEQSSQMLLDLGDGEVHEVRIVDGTLYLRTPLTGEDHFIAVEYDRDDPIVSTYGSIAQQADPGALIHSIGNGVLDVQVDGPDEVVDGVRTTPYTVTVQSVRTVGFLMDLRQQTTREGSDFPAELTYRLWVGEDDLPRRITLDADPWIVQSEVSGWGEPVEIVAPGDDEIVDLGDLDLDG